MPPSAVSPPSTRPPDLSDKLPKLGAPRRKSKQEAPLEPAPETPPLPSPPTLTASHTFSIPRRRILSSEDLDIFLASPTHSLVTAFIFSISDSVRSTPISSVASTETHPTISLALALLASATDLLAEHPAEDNNGSRFGNPAFRGYVAALTERLPQWHMERFTLTSLSHDAAKDEPSKDALIEEAIPEICTYLSQAFGSAQRIDYGSGHELNFMLYLLCLNRLSLLPESTFPQIALLLFPAYLKLMRRIQTTYYLEPAGSHGVWGLDDYQFLPFLFGASQLRDHKYITPKSIHSALVLEECSKDYLYLDQVAFVNSVKNIEGLRWHSPMLDDISSAKNWQKIDAGMRKMFVHEVLAKLPVMQHFLFASLVPAPEVLLERGPGLDAQDDREDAAEGVSVTVDAMGRKHIHREDGRAWGDCCGIPVPSAAGAMGAAGGQQRGLRRIPFD